MRWGDEAARSWNEIARLWNDTCIRIRMHRYGAVGVVATAGVIAMTLLLGAGLSGAAIVSSPPPTRQAPQPDQCHEQTWPYLTAPCLRRGAGEDSKRSVRVITVADGVTGTPPVVAVNGPPPEQGKAKKSPVRQTNQTGSALVR